MKRNLDLTVFIQEIIYLKKDGPYVINLAEFKSIGTHLIALHVNGDNGSALYDAAYFDSFGVKQFPIEIEKFIGNSNIITNDYRIQAYNLIMCGYFCIIQIKKYNKNILNNQND